jgi:hypothetical protein
MVGIGLRELKLTAVIQQKSNHFSVQENGILTTLGLQEFISDLNENWRIDISRRRSGHIPIPIALPKARRLSTGCDKANCSAQLVF